MPFAPGKNTFVSFARKKVKRKTKKGCVKYWKSCKTGIYYYEYVRGFCRKACRFDVREAHFFTENVILTGKFTFYVKPESGFCLKQSLHGKCFKAADNLNNPRSWTV